MKNIHVKTEKLKEIIFDSTVRILPGQIAFFLSHLKIQFLGFYI